MSQRQQDLTDIALDRERMRRRRLARLAVVLGLLNAWLVLRAVQGRPALPVLHVDPLVLVPVLFFVALIAVMVGSTAGAGRSPHVVFRPEQVDVRLDDVIGIDPIVEDVRRSIDLFWTYRRFADQMGGTPRRGLLFEGPPGTGKTMTAKAMAAEAGVPFLFVSATSFQSMYYGATARKIRSYFKALRRAARTEGGAIGFIEEIDAIAMRRGALVASGPGPASPGGGALVERVISEGTGGVVNELLVQMQSFDEPVGSERLVGRLVDAVNLLLPSDRRLRRRRPRRAPVLLIAATNRTLQDQIAAGAFREDLFYRLAVITIEVPRLRDRPGDIPLLARHFAEQAALRAERGRVSFTDAALAHLASQPWPGNVRELENTIERAVILATGDVLDVSDVAGPRPASTASFATFSGDHVPTLDELERAHILKVLELCDGQKTKAAQLLGINRTTLWKKLRQYGLEAD